MKEFSQELLPERAGYLTKMNDKSQKLRENVINTYPCLFFKSQLINGEIRLTEISYSEKYLKDLGYDIEDFSATVFQEGLPMYQIKPILLCY